MLLKEGLTNVKIVIGMPPGASRTTTSFLERFQQVAEANQVDARCVSLGDSRVLSEIRSGDLFISRWDDRFVDREIMELKFPNSAVG